MKNKKFKVVIRLYLAKIRLYIAEKLLYWAFLIAPENHNGIIMYNIVKIYAEHKYRELYKKIK